MAETREVNLQLNILQARDQGLKQVGQSAKTAQASVDRMNQSIKATGTVGDQSMRRMKADFDQLAAKVRIYEGELKKATAQVQKLTLENQRLAKAQPKGGAAGGGLLGGAAGKAGGLLALGAKDIGFAFGGLASGAGPGDVERGDLGLITGFIADATNTVRGRGIKDRRADRQIAENQQNLGLDFQREVSRRGSSDMQFKLGLGEDESTAGKLADLAKERQRLAERLTEDQRALNRQMAEGAGLSARDRDDQVAGLKILQQRAQTNQLIKQGAMELLQIEQQRLTLSRQAKKEAEALQKTLEARTKGLQEQFGELDPGQQEQAVRFAEKIRSGVPLTLGEQKAAEELAPLQGLLKQGQTKEASPLFQEFLKVGGLADDIKKELDELKDQIGKLTVEFDTEEVKRAGKALGEAAAREFAIQASQQKLERIRQETRRAVF